MTEDETIAPAEGSKDTDNGAKTPQAAPVPPAAFAVPAPAAPESPKTDIAKILEDVKLPERRDFKGAGDVSKTVQPAPEAAILEEHIVKAADAAKSKPPAVPDQNESLPQPGEPRSSSIIAPVRTLKDDLQTVVREQKISLVHAASLEEEKKHGQEHLAPEQQEIRTRKSRRTIGIIFASAILLLVSPEFFIALATRSRASSTALSGNPTIENACKPRARSASTETNCAAGKAGCAA